MKKGTYVFEPQTGGERDTLAAFEYAVETYSRGLGVFQPHISTLLKGVELDCG